MFKKQTDPVTEDGTMFSESDMYYFSSASLGTKQLSVDGHVCTTVERTPLSSNSTEHAIYSATQVVRYNICGNLHILLYH